MGSTRPTGPRARELFHLVALDPDKIIQQALATARAMGKTLSEDTVNAEEIAAARALRVATACRPFDNPALREESESARREREQLIDHNNLDQVTFSGFSARAFDAAQHVIQTFAGYIAQHKDEIEALAFFYQQPYSRRTFTFEMIEDLHTRLDRPAMMLTTERLWSAYARVKASQVKGADAKRQLTDLVSLVRFAIGLQSAQAITRADFDYAELARQGGLQKVWSAFGSPLDALMSEVNDALVA